MRLPGPDWGVMNPFSLLGFAAMMFADAAGVIDVSIELTLGLLKATAEEEVLLLMVGDVVSRRSASCFFSCSASRSFFAMVCSRSRFA